MSENWHRHGREQPPTCKGDKGDTYREHGLSPLRCPHLLADKLVNALEKVRVFLHPTAKLLQPPQTLTKHVFRGIKTRRPFARWERATHFNTRQCVIADIARLDFQAPDTVLNASLNTYDVRLPRHISCLRSNRPPYST